MAVTSCPRTPLQCPYVSAEQVRSSSMALEDMSKDFNKVTALFGDLLH
jgi:hypothetical protein